MTMCRSDLKICSCCGVEKPRDEFQVRRASKDGFTASCKLCLKERDRVRDQNPERKAMKERYVKGIGREAAARAKRKYIEKNPKKRSVHIKTGNAIRDGKLLKQPCEVCASENVQAHHCDYDKPLEVMWLCPIHHEEWHRQYGEAKNAV